jgi:hypothetical protein
MIIMRLRGASAIAFLGAMLVAEAASAGVCARVWASVQHFAGRPRVVVPASLPAPTRLPAGPGEAIRAETQTGDIVLRMMQDPSKARAELKTRSIESYVSNDVRVDLELKDGRSLKGRVANTLAGDPDHIEFHNYDTDQIEKVALSDIGGVSLAKQRLQLPAALREASMGRLAEASGQPYIYHSTDPSTPDILKTIADSRVLKTNDEGKAYLSTFTQNDPQRFVSPTLVFKSRTLDAFNYKDQGQAGYYLGRFNKYGRHHAERPREFLYAGTNNEIVFQENLPLSFLDHVIVPPGSRGHYLNLLRDTPSPVAGQSWDTLLREAVQQAPGRLHPAE